MREEQTLPEMRDRLTPAELAFEWRYYQRDARDPSNAELLKFFTDGFNAGIAEGGKDAWQPIETAPKDGTEFWAAQCGAPEAGVLFWDEQEWIAPGEQFNAPNWHPTHWMPLPKGPDHA